ncbi:AMP-binding protein [Streptomonospora wellingtoniae]|uniref:AMP-binding protein n=1 Tax=Streptomonospora wellingtoniae TaxID=3075544 RepID=A0ABU2KXI0_9ACTN|nr:AMP-binding protein [Streptomonospora sp. DSM 45055]MDT0303793.1 AMP-binding protein [Streptomonospora sp. DSM 45055]
MPDPAQQVRDWLATYDTPTASVADLLCDRHPRDRVALTEIGADLDARDVTYGELADRSAALAAGMAAEGVRSGDDVATMVARGSDLAVAALAIWRLGAVHVPLLTTFAPSAIAHRLTPGTALVVADDDQRAKLDPGPDLPEGSVARVATTGAAPLREGDRTLAGLAAAGAGAAAPAAAVGGGSPFVLMHTVGSAGPAKGIPVPVRALAAFHAYHRFGLDVTGDDVYWNTADPSGAYGLYHGLISPLLAGHRTLHLNAGFDPELVLDVLAVHGVTNLAAAPTVYRSLRAILKTLPPEIAVRRLSSAGEPLGADVLEWARDVFGVPVRDHYGQTELGMCAGRANDPTAAADGAEPGPDSLGTALPGWRAGVLEAVADEEAPPGALGRIGVDAEASPLMWFTGYRDAPAATAARFTPEGRWYLTGDAGTRDRAGNLYFASRDDDAILTSGYRIGPFDVESALLEHPAVEEAAVYGEPDEVHGQLVAATVVLYGGAAGDDDLAEDLREIVRTRFASHAYPRHITFADELPRSPSGKIRRSRLGARRG